MGESFNKVLSFILGIIVVIILIAVISSRLRLGEKITLLPLADKNKKSAPTSSIKPTIKPKSKITFFDTTKKNLANATKGGIKTTTPTPTTPVKKIVFTTPTQTKVDIKEIPNTGPEMLLPIAGLSLLTGLYLRRKS